MVGHLIIQYLQNSVWIILNFSKRIVDNGELFPWLDNMRKYSRMKNGGDNKDHRVMGGNPCLEQSLESYELCCLVETFPSNHTDFDDYARTLKYFIFMLKQSHWVELIGVIQIV